MVKSRRDMMLENLDLRINRLEEAMRGVVEFMNEIIHAQMNAKSQEEIPEVGIDLDALTGDVPVPEEMANDDPE